MAVQATPAEVGIELADWNWRVVRRFIEARCGVRLSRGTCLRYLHRLGFVLKRPKKRLLKADEAKRAALVEQYAALLPEAQARGGEDLLRGRGPLPRRRGPAGQVGAEGPAGLGRVDQPALG